VPQSPQYLLAGGFSAPQAEQRSASGAPQSPQNCFLSGFALPQLGHSMRHLSFGNQEAQHRSFPSSYRIIQHAVSKFYGYLGPNGSSKVRPAGN